MLDLEHPGGKRVVVVGSTGTTPWTRIGPSSSSGRTRWTVQPCTRDPRGQRAGVGVQAAEGGQQRGVDVEQPVAPARDEVRRQDAHEAGEADQFDAAARAGASVERRVEGGSVGEAR